MTGVQAGEAVDLSLLPAETLDLRGYLLSQDIEIAHIREGTKIECYVPVNLIDGTDVAVDEAWASELSDNLAAVSREEHGGTGQTSPVILGKIEGEAELKIMDGFHRTSIFRANDPEGPIYSTVKNVTWDELYDYRIFNTKNHPHVRFSRVVQWMNEIWMHSPLSHKLSLTSAITLVRSRGMTGRRLGLQPEEVDAVREWVDAKEEAWGIAAMTIHSQLKAAESVDPEIVRATREKTDSRQLAAPTIRMVSIFAEVIPDRPELQQLVREVATERNLQGPFIKAVCERVKDAIDLDEAKTEIGEIDWETFEPSYGYSQQRALRQAYDPTGGAYGLLGTIGNQLSNIALRVDQGLARGERYEADDPGVIETRLRVKKVAEELTKLMAKLDVVTGNDGEPLFRGNAYDNRNGFVRLPARIPISIDGWNQKVREKGEVDYVLNIAGENGLEIDGIVVVLREDSPLTPHVQAFFNALLTKKMSPGPEGLSFRELSIVTGLNLDWLNACRGVMRHRQQERGIKKDIIEEYIDERGTLRLRLRGNFLLQDSRPS